MPSYSQELGRNPECEIAPAGAGLRETSSVNAFGAASFPKGVACGRDLISHFASQNASFPKGVACGRDLISHFASQNASFPKGEALGRKGKLAALSKPSPLGKVARPEAVTNEVFRKAPQHI